MVTDPVHMKDGLIPPYCKVPAATVSTGLRVTGGDCMLTNGDALERRVAWRWPASVCGRHALCKPLATATVLVFDLAHASRYQTIMAEVCYLSRISPASLVSVLLFA